MCSVSITTGEYRRVFLTKRHAIKLPRLRKLIQGMRCNRWEREVWRVWVPEFRWKNVCPVIFADPFGLIVVMPRAKTPISESDLDRELGGSGPQATAEPKPESYGQLQGTVVAIDYGLPHQEQIIESRKAYLRDARLREW
jgi:hypothetical protein